MRKINFAGKELIKRFESLQLIPYLCPAGILTVGWGHTGKDIVKGRKYTKKECDTLLQKDLVFFENGIDTLLQCDLNENQFSALVCFSYNLGLGALKKSSLLRRLNNKESPNIVARAEMIKFCKITKTRKDGTKYMEELKGLKNRRLAEIALFTQVIDD